HIFALAGTDRRASYQGRPCVRRRTSQDGAEGTRQSPRRCLRPIASAKARCQANASSDLILSGLHQPLWHTYPGSCYHGHESLICHPRNFSAFCEPPQSRRPEFHERWKPVVRLFPCSPNSHLDAGKPPVCAACAWLRSPPRLSLLTCILILWV